LDPSNKKGLFVGYKESSKAYGVYIPKQRKLVVSGDVKFEEDFASRKSHEPTLVAEDKKQEASKVEPRSPVISKAVQQPSSEEGEIRAPSTSIKRPQWFSQTLSDAQEHVETPKSTFRESRPPKKFPNYIALMSSILYFKASSFQEAANQHVWQDAMVEEYTSIMKNDVWDIVPRPKGKSIVSSKWLHKIKHVANGNIEKFKERFVVRGFSQREGVDYKQTFAPVAGYTSIRADMSLVSFMGWRIYQMDVKTTFLNWVIEEEVYIEKPQGFEVSEKGFHVCRLKKSLYGLKQAPRAWYFKIDGYL
jgi:hypothetical protein